MLTSLALLGLTTSPFAITVWPSDTVANVEGHDAETTSIAIAPGEKPNCPKGRLIVSSGWRASKVAGNPAFLSASGQTTQLLVSDLEPGSPTKLVELPVPPGAVRIPGCDSILSKTANGDLLFTYLYAVGDPVTALGAIEAFKKWKSYNGGWRCAFAMWRSTDGGDSWKSSSGHVSPAIILDTALIDGHTGIKADYDRGEYAWPQENNDKHDIWFGGFDRENVYCDPWHPDLIYITCGERSGTARDAANNLIFPNHLLFQNVLFCSKDGGNVWNRPTKLRDQFLPPIEMTSTPPNKAHPNGRLYLLSTGTNAPLLQWSDDFGKTVSTGIECRAGSTADDDFTGVPEKLLPLHTNIIAQFTMARGVSTDQFDTVRVAYSAVKDGHQMIIVVNVVIKSDGTLAVENGIKLLPTDTASGHLLFPHFIETDQCGYMKGKTYNNAVLAWMETSKASASSGLVLQPTNPILRAGGEESENSVKSQVAVQDPYGQSAAKIKNFGEGKSDQLCARAVLLGQATEHSIGPVSILGPISATNGKERVWKPMGGFFGDYLKGAFFSNSSDGSLNYVVQYPARHPNSKFQSVCHNVVTIRNSVVIGRPKGGGG